jgi:CO/xanthine dehydrogenase Mo-binding subunit
MLRIDKMLDVEAHVVPIAEKMGGVGETNVPPITTAVVNAISA